MIYNAFHNNFWEVNEYVYNLIENIHIECEDDIQDEEQRQQIAKLHTLGIISTEIEDTQIVDKLRLNNLMQTFSTDTIAVTLLPTVTCNLVCPYCFERNKPKGIMSEDICDEVVNFIKGHKLAKNLSLTWYGGEPLIGYMVIERFLDRIKDLENINMNFHSLITNATLLTADRWKVFKTHPLDHVQITLDGNRQTHNQRRIRHDGSGTFDDIIRNVKSFSEEFPDTHISFRVNIDRNNAHEFMEVYEYVKSIFFGKKNLQIYPGILSACGAELQDSPFLQNYEIVKLRHKFSKKGYSTAYPCRNCGNCSATTISSYVIGPQGEIYKCWEDAGNKERIVGNIFDKKYTNPALFQEYILHGSQFTDPECWECPILPVCNGNCAKRRIENRSRKIKNELCDILKDEEALDEMLYDFYLSKKKL